MTFSLPEIIVRARVCSALLFTEVDWLRSQSEAFLERSDVRPWLRWIYLSAHSDVQNSLAPFLQSEEEDSQLQRLAADLWSPDAAKILAAIREMARIFPESALCLFEDRLRAPVDQAAVIEMALAAESIPESVSFILFCTSYLPEVPDELVQIIHRTPDKDALIDVLFGSLSSSSHILHELAGATLVAVGTDLVPPHDGEFNPWQVKAFDRALAFYKSPGIPSRVLGLRALRYFLFFKPEELRPLFRKALCETAETLILTEAVRAVINFPEVFADEAPTLIYDLMKRLSEPHQDDLRHEIRIAIVAICHAHIASGSDETVDSLLTQLGNDSGRRIHKDEFDSILSGCLCEILQEIFAPQDIPGRLPIERCLIKRAANIFCGLVRGSTNSYVRAQAVGALRGIARYNSKHRGSIELLQSVALDRLSLVSVRAKAFQSLRYFKINSGEFMKQIAALILTPEENEILRVEAFHLLGVCALRRDPERYAAEVIDAAALAAKELENLLIHPGEWQNSQSLLHAVLAAVNAFPDASSAVAKAFAA